jgi:hypothetical protein
MICPNLDVSCVHDESLRLFERSRRQYFVHTRILYVLKMTMKDRVRTPNLRETRTSIMTPLQECQSTWGVCSGLSCTRT